MIVVKLQGGLGNQMFQYAVGRHLSIKNNVKLILDLSFLDQKENLSYTLRDFELDIFRISADYRHKNIYFGRSIWSKIKTKIYQVKYIQEHSTRFMPDVLSLHGNIYLNGFWQTEKYFDEVKDIIKKDFAYKFDLDETNIHYSEQIKACNAVSVHVRRGDYVSTTLAPTYHNLCSLNYYQDAIKLISKSVKNPVFFIFSDDMHWVKLNLTIPYPHYFIDHNNNKSNHLDMRLMSLCKHNIMANSSFSWWGAWLNANDAKMVIAPTKWFNNSLIDTADIIPKTWILI